ncbi:MAG: hypothetical protein CMJ49_04695 [Planctomycetaceae bacterium]|nr:hypothetical protein [Planctomycetaceae bacterium]
MIALAAVVAIAISIFQPYSAQADSAYIKKIQYPGIRIIGLEDGRLVYELNGSERRVSISDVTRIQLEHHPAFNEAEQALFDGDPAESIDAYEKLVDELKPGPMRTLVRARLIQAHDRSGHFDQALQQYLDMIEADHGAHMMWLVPSAAPPNATAQADAVQRAQARLSETNDLIARRALEMLIARVSGHELHEASRETTAPGSAESHESGTVGPDAAPRVPVTDNDVVARLLNAGQFEQVIERTDVELEKRNAPLSRHLYYRGLAEAELGRDMDALISLMRVVVHFERGPYAGFCMMRAGEIYHKRGAYDKAERLLSAARDRDELSAHQRQRIDELLDADIPDSDE